MTATTELAREHKKLGLCAVCNRQVHNGKTRCLYHLYQNARSTSKYSKKNRHKQSEWNRLRHEKCKRENLCYDCGRPIVDGILRCTDCYDKHLLRMR